jgi:GT2 family glycosyltransferase
MNLTSSKDGKISLVVAVVLHYQNREMTLQCIESLVAQTYSALEIIVVDNQSPDDAFKMLSALYKDEPKVTVIQNRINAGYAGGNNFGVRWRREKGPFEYLLIVNNDIEIVEKDVIEKLVGFAEATTDLAGVQPRIALTNGLLQGPYLKPNILIDTLQFLIPPIWFLRRKLRQKKIVRIKQPVPCFRVLGAFFLVRAREFFDVGMFDENTFLYREEDILAVKLKSMGLQFYYYPDVEVIHRHDPKGWLHFTRKEQFNAYLESERYFFGQVLGYRKALVKLNSLSRNIYYRFFHPIRKLLNFD